MAEPKSVASENGISREGLAQLLNEDLSREYQAIIAYVVYSQVLKGAEFMNIADQLEEHAKQELQHALIVSRQIDYLGAMPTVNPTPVQKILVRCSVSICKTRMTPSAIIATAFANANSLESTRWPNRSAKSW
jgi:rubrerythrin